MFHITKEVQFDAGHRVPNHKSKCRNPHGHRYRVVAHLEAPSLVEEGSSEGMVADFGDLKAEMMKVIHDEHDHGFIVSSEDKQMMDVFFPFRYDDTGAEMVPGDEPRHNWKIIVVPFSPTAEHLAEYFFTLLNAVIEDRLVGCRLTAIDVWETPTSCASYSPFS